MKNKRVPAVVSVLLLALMLSACADKSQKIVGCWNCELYGSEQIIEFTSDGHFIDHTNLGDNRYRFQGSDLVIYVEDEPESALRFDYSVKGDILTLGNVEYTRISDPAMLSELTNE